MRVLIAVHGYPPGQTGGAERRAARTARGLVQRGHDVRVLAIESFDSGTGPSVSDRLENGVHVRLLALDNVSAGTDRFRVEYDNPLTALAINDEIDAWQPDIVHLFSGYLMTASVVRQSVVRGLPAVVSLTDYWWLCHRINMIRPDGTRCDGPSDAGCAKCHSEQYRRVRLPSRVLPSGAEAFWRASERWNRLGVRAGLPRQATRQSTLLETLGTASALIAPSQYLADFYIRHGIASSLVRVWRQGVELNTCRLRQPASELRIGYLGQMKYHKGVDLLLDAWGRLSGDRARRLMLFGSDAGEPGYGRQLRTAIARLDGVSWAGEFRSAEVWDVLAAMDVLVVPSRWVENSPNVILEAQAVGVPIIGSNLGGVAEMVQHEENGLLFTVDDVHDLARQLQRLIDEPELLTRLRQWQLPFRTLDDEVDQIAALYRDLVPGAPDDPHSLAFNPTRVAATNATSV
jgi:glycosyltransferase involved in cell wall biosynthesis